MLAFVPTGFGQIFVKRFDGRCRPTESLTLVRPGATGSEKFDLPILSLINRRFVQSQAFLQDSQLVRLAFFSRMYA